MKIEIRNHNIVKASLTGDIKIQMFYNEEYQEGDMIFIYPDETPTYLNIKIDDAIEESMVYIKEGYLQYRIPDIIMRKSFSYKAFYNKKHLISVSKTTFQQISTYQNLSKNTLDQINHQQVYPHVESSLDKQLQPIFAAKNVIDGLTFNCGHGRWPYTSWSYMQDENAELLICFGRKVDIEEIHFYLRSDFPHDSYFQNISLEFSNNMHLQIHFIKTEHVQIHKVKLQNIEWIRFYNFQKKADNIPFAAITQIEVYGYNHLKVFSKRVY